MVLSSANLLLSSYSFSAGVIYPKPEMLFFKDILGLGLEKLGRHPRQNAHPNDGLGLVILKCIFGGTIYNTAIIEF